MHCTHRQQLGGASDPSNRRGKGNWLFAAGSLRVGQRPAAVMSLIQSAKLNGLDPCAYLKDVLLCLPTSSCGCSENYCRIAGSL